MMWNLQSYPATVSNERVWHLGVKRYSDSTYMLSGSQDPTPMIYAPVFQDNSVAVLMHLENALFEYS